MDTACTWLVFEDRIVRHVLIVHAATEAACDLSCARNNLGEVLACHSWQMSFKSGLYMKLSVSRGILYFLLLVSMYVCTLCRCCVMP